MDYCTTARKPEIRFDTPVTIAIYFIQILILIYIRDWSYLFNTYTYLIANTFYLFNSIPFIIDFTSKQLISTLLYNN